MGKYQYAIPVALLTACLVHPAWAAQAAKKPAKSKTPVAAKRDIVLVTVNGKNITETELNRMFMTRQVREEQRDKARDAFLEEMIDARLIQQFLDSRDTKASKQELDAQVNRIRDAAKQRGSDPDKVLADLGYTAESLREEFAIPLAWKHHVDRAVPPARLKTYFDEHRAEFDGTKVKASHIIFRLHASDDEQTWKEAEAKLGDIRKRIVKQEISFYEAAHEYSQAPSKEEGGDVGEFPFVGKMPEQFSREAFRLKVGEMSQPFRSKFGVHLCVVTGRKPGDLSLEDVRDEVLARLSQEMWKLTVADMRKTAKIEWKVDKQASATKAE
jgi:peptidyl-prolyl cis-trans isomerase C